MSTGPQNKTADGAWCWENLGSIYISGIPFSRHWGSLGWCLVSPQLPPHVLVPMDALLVLETFSFLCLLYWINQLPFCSHGGSTSSTSPPVTPSTSLYMWLLTKRSPFIITRFVHAYRHVVSWRIRVILYRAPTVDGVPSTLGLGPSESVQLYVGPDLCPTLKIRAKFLYTRHGLPSVKSTTAPCRQRLK